MKTNWWSKLMAAIKSWLDRNSEKETHPPAITIPDQVDVPQGNTPGLEPDKSYLDRPWNNPATLPADRGVDVGGTRKYSVINGSEWGGGYNIVCSKIQIIMTFKSLKSLRKWW